MQENSTCSHKRHIRFMLYFLSPLLSINKRTSLLNARSRTFFDSDLRITATSYSLKKTCQKGIMVPYSLCLSPQTASAFSPGCALSSHLWIEEGFDIKKLVQQRFDSSTLPAWDKNWSLLKPNLFILPNTWHHCFLVLLRAPETPEWCFLSGPISSLQNTCRF